MDLIVAKVLSFKFIIAEQICPTPAHRFPAAMELDISKKAAGSFNGINAMITEKFPL